MILLDMINKTQTNISSKMFTHENNILTLEFDPQDYDITDKVITASFSMTEVETMPLEVVNGIIQLPIHSNLIKYGINYIQLNFRWDNKLEQSGKISWKIDTSIATSKASDESINIISHLINEVNIAKDTMQSSIDDFVAETERVETIYPTRLTEVETDLAEYKLNYAQQVGTVANLTTTSKEVVGAVNELNTNKANKVQEAWIVPTLLNGWTSATIAYMKDTLGFVHLKGMLGGGTFGLIAFTLPVGYRPFNNYNGYPVKTGTVSGGIGVRGSGNGAVIPTNGNINEFYVDGVTFKAEA